MVVFVFDNSLVLQRLRQGVTDCDTVVAEVANEMFLMHDGYLLLLLLLLNLNVKTTL